MSGSCDRRTYNVMLMVLQSQMLQSGIQQLNDTISSWQACYYEVCDVILPGSCLHTMYSERVGVNLVVWGGDSKF